MVFPLGTSLLASKHIGFVIPPSPGNRQIIRLIDCSHEAKGDYLWQPNDFLIISSLLRPQDKATLVDGTADRLSAEDFLRQVDGLQPDLLFVALSSVCWQSDLVFFRQVKERHPGVPLYALGDIFLEEEYLTFILNECVGVVANPYLLDLAAMAGPKNGVATSLPGLRLKAGGAFPGEARAGRVQGGIPRHSLFQKRGYRFPLARHHRHATVTTMWGCPFSCSYCPDSLFQPVVREVDSVLAELRELRRLGIRELFFADKTFGYPLENGLSLLQEMAGSFRFSWSCYFHPQLYRPELLDAMHRAGCHTVIVGIDSARPETLQRYNRRVDEGKIEALVGHANRLRMNVCADFILGLEHEDETDMAATIDYALRLPIDFASFNIAAPFPGTEIRRRARQAGRMAFGAEGCDSLTHETDLGICGAGRDAVRRLRNTALRKFYLRPGYLLRRLARTVSLEHFFIQLGQMVKIFGKA